MFQSGKEYSGFVDDICFRLSNIFSKIMGVGGRGVVVLKFPCLSCAPLPPAKTLDPYPPEAPTFLLCFYCDYIYVKFCLVSAIFCGQMLEILENVNPFSLLTLLNVWGFWCLDKLGGRSPSPIPICLFLIHVIPNSVWHLLTSLLYAKNVLDRFFILW